MMIQIIPIAQFSNSTTFPVELLQLIALQQKESKLQAFPTSEEGLFVVVKNEQLIGYGNVVASAEAPPTSGIGKLNHCFILPTERQKGHGTQLFKHLRQYAVLHFGLLELNPACPLRNQMGKCIDLETYS